MSEVMKHFHDLHQIPEIAMQEFKTAAYVADVLKKAGFQVQTGVGGTTGVVGVLDSGKPGPVLGLRSDMDAWVLQGQLLIYAPRRSYVHAPYSSRRNSCRKSCPKRKAEGHLPARRRNRNRSSGHV